MSPFSKPVILDNCCISNFQTAGVLKLILSLWLPGIFKIPQRVLNEAGDWKEHGKEVMQTINELRDAKIIEIVNIEEDSEEEINAYIKLRLSAPVLGEGESESMAIAYNRDYIVATDDGIATEFCQILFPSINIITTAQILNMGKTDGLITKSQVDHIWTAIKSNQANSLP